MLSDIFLWFHSKHEAKAVYVVKQDCGHDIWASVYGLDVMLTIATSKLQQPWIQIVVYSIDWNTTICSFSKLGNMWLRNERTTKQWCLIAMPYGNISWYKDWLVTCTIFQYNFHFRDSAIDNFQGLNFRLHI